MKTDYSKEAKKNHPDKGGDQEKFQVIQHAYAILSDEKKREYYDKTGQEQKTQPFEVKFGIFVKLLRQADVTAKY